MAEVYVAKSTFYAELEGRRFLVSEGDTAREGHPILSKYRNLFEVQRLVFEHQEKTVRKKPEVEQATAAPGEQREIPEKRGPGRPKLPRDDAGNIIREEG